MTRIIESIFTYKGRKCVVVLLKDNSGSTHGWRCGYVESIFNREYSKYYHAISCEEPTYSGDLNGEVEGDEHYIGFDTNHYHDTPESRTQPMMYKRITAFADELIAAEETIEGYKDRPCYLAGPIQHFSGHRELFEKIKNDPKKLKEYLFANWSEAYSWAVEAVLELKELGIIKVFSPHLYTIPFAKRVYDIIGDDRDYWMAINFNMLDRMVGSEFDEDGYMLMSNRAFSKIQGEIIWHSTGSKEEWEFCKDNGMQCFVYEAFIEGDIVSL